MKKVLLKEGDRCYSTGCFLIYHEKGKFFIFDGYEDDTFFDGELINWDDQDRPYIEK